MVDLVNRNARIYPDEAASGEIRPVSRARSEISWKQFNDGTNCLANALIRRGVNKGSRVFLLGRNSISWLEVYFFIIKTGAWVNPLNFRLTDDDSRSDGPMTADLSQGSQ
ncbi:MAG: AMP-binding protein [Syntrophorhabdales bacterium]|jgi:acyl-CoA synthetase (AMP-forming)/AMP-acid ligase II